MKAKILFLLLFFAAFISANSTCRISGDRFACIKNVTFYTVSFSGKTAAYYRWSLTNGYTSKDQTPGIYWTAAGSFVLSVKVKFTDSSDCSDTFKVVVHHRPILKFDLSRTDSCVNNNKLTVTNNSVSDRNLTSFKSLKVLWGDGQSETFNNQSKGSSIQKYYTSAGNFRIEFYLTDLIGCKNDTNIYIKIHNTTTGGLNSKITEQCGYTKICFNPILDTFGLSNQLTWEYDNTKITDNYVKSNCFEFKNKLVNFNLNVLAVNKFGCKTKFTYSKLINSDTIAAYLTKYDSVFCTTDTKERSIKLENPYSNYNYRWSTDVKNYYYSFDSRFDFKPNNLLSEKDTVNVTVEISNQFCKKKFTTTVRAKGFRPKLKFYNTQLCKNSGQPISTYVLDQTKYKNSSKIYRYYSFGDTVSPQCTTQRFKNVNKSTNCNFAKLDYWAKHKYPQAQNGLFPLRVTLYDSASQCSFEKDTTVIIEDCEVLFCSGSNGDIKYKIRKCVGELFLNSNEYQGKTPDYFSFDSTIWKSFPSILRSSDAGLNRNVWIQYNEIITGMPYEKGDSLLVRVDTIPGKIQKINGTIDIIDVTKNPIISIKSGNCDTVFFRLIPKYGNITTGDTITIYDQIQNKIIYQTVATTTNPFKEYLAYPKKGETLVYYAQIKNGNCIHRNYFNLTTGFKITATFPNVCGKKRGDISLEVYDYDNAKYWNSNGNYYGDVYIYINNKLVASDKYLYTHYFQSNTSYTIKILAISAYGCRDSIVKTLSTDSLVAGIKPFLNPITCNEEAKFYDSSYLISTSDSIVKYDWILQGTNIATSQKNPTIKGAMGGKYKLQHIIYTQKGCVDTAVREVVVYGPEPKFMVDTLVCMPGKVTFKNLSTNCKSYIWFFNDSMNETKTTDKDTNINFTYGKPGVYLPVILGSGEFISPNTGLKYQCNYIYPSAPQKEIKVTVLKGDTVSILGSDTLCLNEMGNFQLKSSGKLLGSFQWNFGDGNTITHTDKKQLHSYNSIGIKSISVKQSSAECVQFKEKNVYILPVDSVKISAYDSFCSGHKIKFKIQNYNSNNNPYKWLFNSSDSSYSNNDSLLKTFKTPGKYKVQASINNSSAKSCIEPAFKEIVILPMDTFNFIGKSYFCSTDSIEFYIRNINLKYTPISWYLNDTLIQEGNKNWGKFKNPGSGSNKITIKSTNPNAKQPYCISDNTQYFVVGNPVKADFVFNPIDIPLFHFTNTSTNASSYIWNFDDPKSGGNNESDLENPDHYFIELNADKNVCLWAFDDSGCLDSICKKIEVKDEESIRITNVFTPGNNDNKNDVFDIYISGEDFYYLRIYNRYGAQVYESKFDAQPGDGKNWNGNVDNTGAACPEGTYYYEFIYSFKSSKDKKTIKGGVQLIR